MSMPEFMARMAEAMKKLVRWEGFNKEEVDAAVDYFIANMDVVKLHFLENCVGCGACAPSCPYYFVDEKYSPVNKAEEARRIYRKKFTIAGMVLGPLVEARLPKSDKDLDRIVELIWRCSGCGACYTACPFGVDSGSLINLMRGFMTFTKRVPTLMAAFEMLETEGYYRAIPAFTALWQQTIDAIERELGRKVELDKKGAEALYLPSIIDALYTPSAVVAGAKILDKLGIDWTMPSTPIGVRPPIAAVLGRYDRAKKVLSQVYEYTTGLGVKELIMIDGGFPYPWLRFQMPISLGKRPRFKVKHLVEVLVEAIEAGRLKLKQVDDKVTWHPPCQMTRRAGLTVEPVYVLSRVSRGFRRLPHHGLESYCCGGGSGMGCMTRDEIEAMAKFVGMPASMFVSGEKERRFLEETEKAYKAAIRRKMKDIEKSGAEIVVTACPVCIHTIELGAKLYGPSVKVVHLADYIADKMA